MTVLKTKEEYGFSNGPVHVVFDKNGFILDAKNFRRMIWWRVDEDIDKILIGKHISELSEILKKNCAYRETYMGFQKDVASYFKPRRRILSLLKKRG